MDRPLTSGKLSQHLAQPVAGTEMSLEHAKNKDGPEQLKGQYWRNLIGGARRKPAVNQQKTRV